MKQYNSLVCAMTRRWRLMEVQALSILLGALLWQVPKVEAGVVRCAVIVRHIMFVLAFFAGASSWLCAQVPRIEPHQAWRPDVGRFAVGSGNSIRRGSVRLARDGGGTKLIFGFLSEADSIGSGGVLDLRVGDRVVYCLIGPGVVVAGADSGSSYIDAVDLVSRPASRRIYDEDGDGDIVVLDCNHRERALYLLSCSRSEIVRLPLESVSPLVMKPGEGVQRLPMPKMWVKGMEVELRSYSWPEEGSGCAEGGYLLIRDLKRGSMLAWRMTGSGGELRLNRIPISDMSYIPEGAWRLYFGAGLMGGLLVDCDFPANGQLSLWSHYGLPDADGVGRRRIADVDLGGARPMEVLGGDLLQRFRGRWLTVDGGSMSQSRPVYVPWQLGGDIGNGRVLRFEAAPFSHPYPGISRYQVAFRSGAGSMPNSITTGFLLVAAMVDSGGVEYASVRRLLWEGGASAAFAPAGAFEYGGAWFDISVPESASVGDYIVCQVHVMDVKGPTYDHVASSEIVAVEILAAPPRSYVPRMWDPGVKLDLGSPMGGQSRELLSRLRQR